MPNHTERLSNIEAALAKLIAHRKRKTISKAKAADSVAAAELSAVAQHLGAPMTDGAALLALHKKYHG